MNNYRPEGWENPYTQDMSLGGYRGKIALMTVKELTRCEGDIYEAGADAIVSRLIGYYNSVYIDGVDTSEFVKVLRPKIKGHLVFIPEVVDATPDS